MNSLPGPDDPLKAVLEWCFTHRPTPDDWEKVLAEPSALDVQTLVQDLAALGPEGCGEDPATRIRAWRLQQRLRIALRHQRGLPLQTRFTCGNCGTRRTDPVLLECLHCVDVARQLAHFGNRGSCHFHREAFDPATGTWGILIYTSSVGDERAPLLCFAVTGYRTREEAFDALLPLSNYAEYAQSLTTRYVDMAEVADFVAIVDRGVPMGADDWTAFLRGQITQHFREFEPDSLENSISHALGDISREDREPEE